jgi:hypothetical protein
VVAWEDSPLLITGTLTIASARSSNGKSLVLPQTFNPTTGKESTCKTGFNDTACGKMTRSYTMSASMLPKTKIDKIIQEAKPFINYKTNCSYKKTKGAIEIDERACILISDEDCKLSLLLPCDPTNMII